MQYRAEIINVDRAGAAYIGDLDFGTFAAQGRMHSSRKEEQLSWRFCRCRLYSQVVALRAWARLRALDRLGEPRRQLGGRASRRKPARGASGSSGASA